VVTGAAGDGLGDERPIGIFDSGVGGLTVMDSITKLLPQENLIYFGDTARFPYGPRPIEQIRQFAIEIMDMMVSQQVKMLVVACNSMTAAVRDSDTGNSLPTIGVIEPAVRAAVRATHNRKVGVLGTRATISSKAYERSLEAASHGIEVSPVVCEGFVEKVETGDTFSEALFSLAEGYVSPLLNKGVDTMILGCTHYPLLTGVLHSVTNGQVELISSADEVAKDVYAKLVELGLLRRAREIGSRRFLVSGDATQFRLVGSRFLPALDKVETVVVA